MDGLTPNCQTESGCLIPSLRPAGQRVLEIRSRIVQLQRLIDPGTICRLFDADLDDLRLLALVETELKPERDADGQGH